MFDIITLCCKKKKHALFCLYYVVIYEFKYESKMLKPSRLVLVGRDTHSHKTCLFIKIISLNILLMKVGL